MRIREQRTFVRDDGATVHQLTQDGGMPMFLAHVNHVIEINGRQVQDVFPLEFAADSPSEAFDVLERLASNAIRQRVEYLNNQMRQQMNKIVSPNGRPLS